MPIYLPATPGPPLNRQHTLTSSSPSPYPHMPIAELGFIQGKAEPPVTEHRARPPRDRVIFAATGTSRGRLRARGTAGGQQEGSALGAPSDRLSLPQPFSCLGHLGRESRVWTLSRGTKGEAQKGQVVLRFESSGAQPAMISSSYTRESQARHKEQLDSRICGQGDPRKRAVFSSRAPAPHALPCPFHLSNPARPPFRLLPSPCLSRRGYEPNGVDRVCSLPGKVVGKVQGRR